METLLVIGGSKGIGKAIIEENISDNYVINISRTSPDLNHANLKHISLDALVDPLPDIEQVDRLVYCLGSINLKPFKSLKESIITDDFNINVLGAVRIMQKYLPKLEASSNGSIVLFSTVAVKLGMPFHASVAMAKGALEGLAKTVAAEYATKVRCNIIAPTITDTPLGSRVLRNDRMREAMVERHPYKQYLQPKEVAQMATYLMSSISKPVSGQVFQLDAGITTVKL